MGASPSRRSLAEEFEHERPVELVGHLRQLAGVAVGEPDRTQAQPGMTEALGAGTPAASAYAVTSWRWLSGGAVGASRNESPPGLAAGLGAVRDELGVTLPDGAIAAGVFAWAALFGCVSWEIFGQYGRDGMGDPEALFEHRLVLLAAAVGTR